MPIPRILRCSRGQSLVEFSLILPILMILVFGILDFGLGLRSYISLSNAVREGARYASVGNPVGIESDCNGMTNDTVYGRICVATGGLDLTELDPDVSFPQGVAPGNSVVVSADYTYQFVTPIGDLIGFFSGGAFPSSIDLSSSANMRLE
ncbi:MAG: pilus assembly protein [Chloroflexi bacterium]|nr:pilus assembly protein [Chloroflexota bacterium]